MLREAYQAAQSTMSDLSGFCGRNPAVCATGGQMLTAFGKKARRTARRWFISTLMKKLRMKKLIQPLWKANQKSEPDHESDRWAFAATINWLSLQLRTVYIRPGFLFRAAAT